MTHIEARPRRERCYKLVNPELVQAAILRRDPQSAESIVAELREIAPSGAKLLVTGPPELRYQCRISLKSHRLKHPLLLPAEIHWARPNPAGDWLLGCRFDAPLSDATLEEWITSGVLNRRSSVRERSRIPVQVQMQPGKPRLPAVVSDFSEGGLCLTTSDTRHGTRHVCLFALILGREVRVPLKIRWTLSVGPNRFIGCQFMRPMDYESLCKLHLETRNAKPDGRQHTGQTVGHAQSACGNLVGQRSDVHATELL